MLSAEVDLCVCSELARKRWTRAECEQVSELLPEQHLELVEGKLIDKMGKNWRHVSSLVVLQAWLVGIFGLLRVVPEPSIDVAPQDNPTSEPEPDLIVTKQDLQYYIDKGRPGPEDLQLVVEIADSSLRFDLTTKAALYARARIADYWVLDVAGRRMIVHRDPQAEGYRTVTVFGAEDSVAPLAAPTAFLRIGDAFVRGGR
ncbi:MAG: Uma2 family endonuclease [Bryobacteraceae bacterium]